MITSSGDTYTITVKYDEKAGIPEGAELKVKEIEEKTKDYKEYVKESAEKLGVKADNVAFARFFDIEIVKDGKKIEPETPVEVRMEYKEALDLKENKALNVVHFADKETEVISDIEVSDDLKEVTYEQGSFSVTGTVITDGSAGALGQKYVLIVKHDGNYYSVNSDGSLERVGDNYDPATNKLTVDLEYPLMWTYQDCNKRENPNNPNIASAHNFLIPTVAKSFKGNNLPDVYCYRYINPNKDNGLSEEERREDLDLNNQGHRAQWNTYINNCAKDAALHYENNLIHGDGSNAGNYIGVSADGSRIIGKVSQDNAAELYLATVDVPAPSTQTHNEHMVNHIDISIDGDSTVKIPLAYGEYYDANGNIIYTANQVNHILEMNPTITITEEDMKHASIIATAKDENGVKQPVDNAFYITGYSQNRESKPNEAPQVRVEGSFKVANIPYADNADNREEIRIARKNNQIYYTVEVEKTITVDVKYNGTQLYDSTGKKLTFTLPVTLSDSFSYWDDRNECPPLHKYYDKDLEFHEPWKRGEIMGGIDEAMSGMDFALGTAASDQLHSVPALEVTKVMQKEDGSYLETTEKHDVGVDVFYKERADREEDALIGKGVDLAISEEELSSLTSGYQKLHQKDVSVGTEGMGASYDYDVSEGMIYIQEDESTVPEYVNGTDGKQYKYKETRIETEYVWRTRGDENKTHQTVGMKSSPEVLGHYTYNGSSTDDEGKPLNNTFLEFYVYNVYEEIPKIDVPVEKTWDDFDATGCEWKATLRLQWAPIYEGQTHTGEDFRDVVGPDGKPMEIEITKAMMAQGEESLSQRTFKDLPKYGYDPIKGAYRIQYSVEEMRYWAVDNTGKTYTFTWPNTYTLSEEEFTAFYPHDAGEISEDDSDYYIAVANHEKAVKGEKYIDFNVTKTWSDEDILDDDDAYATFKVFYNKRVDHRDISHMDEADKNAVPITVTLKDTSGKVYDTVEVQPHTGLRISTVLKGRTESISISVSGGDYTGTNTIYAHYNLDEETKVFDGKAYPPADCDIVLSGNISYLDSASLLDTTPGTTHETDVEVMEFTLNKENHWTKNLELLHEKTIAGGDANNENVEVYEYYLKEVASNPAGFAAKFYEEGTDKEEGDKYNPIFKGTDDIEARNEPQKDLVVEKVWRGIPDNTGYPTVYFTLYQCRPGCDNVGNASVYVGAEKPYEGAPSTRYEKIPLSSAPGTDHDFRWVCPETLPVRDQNGNRLAYFVVESPNRDTVDGVTWKCYGYSQAPDPDTKKYKDGTFGDQNQPYRAQIAGNEGTFVIHNAVSDYMQMDLQKQFFKIGDAGSWGNVTSQMCHDAVLGIKVIRRIVYPDNTMSSWSDYGDEMLVGYGKNQEDYILDNGTNGFYLENAGGDWAFRIRDQGGDLNSERIGLPKEGIANYNGELKRVYYQYSFRETGVYKDTDRTPYPDWEWFSNMTPDNYYDKYGSHKFERENTSDDPMRIMNYQASNLIIDKRWLGEPNAKEVYIKIWRETEDGTKEDFTAVIADDVSGQSHPAEGSENWQGYVDDPSLIDTDNKLLIVKSDKTGKWTSTVKIHNVLIRGHAAKGTAPLYTYYIEEVGYKDKNGAVHMKPEKTLGEFETHYTRWVKDGYWEVNPLPNGKDKSIQLGAIGENRFQVMNAPEMDLTVKKEWLDSEGNPRDAWHDSITFQIEQVSRKYDVDGNPTGDTKRALVNIGGNTTFRIYNTAQNAHWIIKPNHDQHEQYTIDTSDGRTNNNGAPWTFYVDGLQEGYFDADNGEWHCEYIIKEVNVLKSDVTIQGNGVSTDGHTVTIKNTYSNTSAVKVNKIFSGIDSLPETFKITASWTDTNGSHALELNTSGASGDFAGNVTFSGNGSDGTPYTWTINKIPVQDPPVVVTFTESGFADSDDPAKYGEYTVEVTSETDAGVSNQNPSTTAAVQDEAIAEANFTNTYITPGVDIKILKVDDKNAPLDGAKFSLSRCDTVDGTYTIVTEIEGVTLDENHWFTVPGNGGLTLPKLSRGFYKITEHKAPDGYVITDAVPVSFEITATGDVVNKSITAVTYNATDHSFKVPNPPGAELPKTGGIGTTIFYVLGSLLVITGGIFLIARRRMAR